MKDSELLQIYLEGWEDESLNFKNSAEIDSYTDLALKAYNLGRSHFLLGDHFTSYDDLTNKDIFTLIK
jgi:hypothetical protein